MGVIASWGSKKFEVNPKKIYPFRDFSTGFKLKTDANADTSGTSPTNTRGRELEQITSHAALIFWRLQVWMCGESLAAGGNWWGKLIPFSSAVSVLGQGIFSWKAWIYRKHSWTPTEISLLPHCPLPLRNISLPAHRLRQRQPPKAVKAVGKAPQKV